jgi:hypothetical protein
VIIAPLTVVRPRPSRRISRPMISPHDRKIHLLAEDRLKGIHDDRFPGPRLTRQHRQSRLEGQLKLVDDGETFYGEKFEHGNPQYSGFRIEYSVLNRGNCFFYAGNFESSIFNS